MTSESQEYKADAGKRRWSLMPLRWLRPVLDVFEFGRGKYEAFSFLDKVPDAETRYADSLMRHIEDWQSGITFDRESGAHPLAHVAANCMILMALEDPTLIPEHLRG